MRENVVLVDKNDQEVGMAEKLEAHQKGLLHRAISVFIFNDQGEMLLQRRALTKYHTPGIWSNTACSHPRANEDVLEAATRRLNEEMGMKIDLTFGFKFLYKAEFENGLIEHELDHVFFGISNDKPNINLAEVCDYKYLCETELEEELRLNPSFYSPWFKICYQQVFKLAKEFLT